MVLYFMSFWYNIRRFHMQVKKYAKYVLLVLLVKKKVEGNTFLASLHLRCLLWNRVDFLQHELKSRPRGIVEASFITSVMGSYRKLPALQVLRLLPLSLLQTFIPFCLEEGTSPMFSYNLQHDAGGYLAFSDWFQEADALSAKFCVMIKKFILCKRNNKACSKKN